MSILLTLLLCSIPLIANPACMIDGQEVFLAEYTYNKRGDNEYFFNACCQPEPEHPWDCHSNFTPETCQDGCCSNDEYRPNYHDKLKDLFHSPSSESLLARVPARENCNARMDDSVGYQTSNSGAHASHGLELCLMLLMVAVSTQMILLPIWTIALLTWTFSKLAADLVQPSANETLPSIVFIVVKPI